MIHTVSTVYQWVFPDGWILTWYIFFSFCLFIFSWIFSDKYVCLCDFITIFSFFNLIFILYWSIVDLKCCVSFRYTAKWFSYTYTYIHSFSDSFPIEVITEYWVEFPVLYSRSLLIICFIYSSIYMLIPNSLFSFMGLQSSSSLLPNTTL